MNADDRRCGIRALSVRPPWAWAILHAGKRIENRTWTSAYRGWVLVHASAKTDVDVHTRHRLNAALEETGQPRLTGRAMRALSHGAIVGAVRITDWDHCSWIVQRWRDLYTRQAPWIEGPNCIVLDDVIALAEPVPCKGQLKLWTPPAEVVRGVRQQIWAGISEDLKTHLTVPARESADCLGLIVDGA